MRGAHNSIKVTQSLILALRSFPNYQVRNLGYNCGFFNNYALFTLFFVFFT